MRRANNQDSAAVSVSDSAERWQRRGHLFVVADGMGAHAAGELASSIACEQIPHHYFRQTDPSIKIALRRAIQDSNAAIFQRGQQNPEFHNMGTTASTLVVAPEGAYVGHVGDSRCYRLRNQVLEQLTFDHSLVWEMEAAGQLGDPRLNNAIPKNVITRSLGPTAQVMVDVEGPFPLKEGDTFLLCSDGLSGQVEDDEIGVLMDCLPPAHACRALIDLANLRGGPDNITIIIVRVDKEELESASAGLPTGGESLPSTNTKKISAPLLATSATCLLAAAIFALTQTWLLAIPFAIVGTISGILLFFGTSRRKDQPTEENTPRRTTSPYRRYRCNDSSLLNEKLAKTVGSLREVATENNWSVNWNEVNSLEYEAKQALENGDHKRAVQQQSEAVIAAMEQLREQHRRQGSDSTIDF